MLIINRTLLPIGANANIDIVIVIIIVSILGVDGPLLTEYLLNIAIYVRFLFRYVVKAKK